MRLKNKIFIGTGLTGVITGIAAILFTDKLNGAKTRKLANIAGIVVALLGLAVTAKALDEELYPEPYTEEV